MRWMKHDTVVPLSVRTNNNSRIPSLPFPFMLIAWLGSRYNRNNWARIPCQPHPANQWRTVPVLFLLPGLRINQIASFTTFSTPQPIQMASTDTNTLSKTWFENILSWSTCSGSDHQLQWESVFCRSLAQQDTYVSQLHAQYCHRLHTKNFKPSFQQGAPKKQIIAKIVPSSTNL